MPLHRLLGIDVGVPEPQILHDFYAHIGFVDTGEGWGQKDAPDQIRVEEAPYRQLTRVRLGCHDESDLVAIGGRLDGLGITHETRDGTLHVVDPVNKWKIEVTTCAEQDLTPNEERIVNRPGVRHRTQARPFIMTEDVPRPPRRLGHFVIGTPDLKATHALYVEGLGFRVSDIVADGLADRRMCFLLPVMLRILDPRASARPTYVSEEAHLRTHTCYLEGPAHSHRAIEDEWIVRQFRCPQIAQSQCQPSKSVYQVQQCSFPRTIQSNHTENLANTKNIERHIVYRVHSTERTTKVSHFEYGCVVSDQAMFVQIVACS